MVGLTVAVNATARGAVTGFELEVRIMEENAFTVSAIAGEVDEGRLISPGYCAVNE